MTRTKRTAVLASALLAIGLTHAGVAQADDLRAAGTCDFADTLCLWDQTNFNGAQMNLMPLPPSNATCVDLAAHGWGGRVRSAINTSSKTAALFITTDCTGHPYGVSGSAPSVGIAANSVWVQR
ncbi:peptidase inhibitor family I36 protein [Saccharothrix yanglingensis]|uniref:Peptidase inhibitor family I36 n=1 Tax=Saccharothrix yanglingensis TaxID=659496 RepID=A0ABU0X4P8_9PSEU|nr:peptidase inhibitor family I36 protein [Saccharothrix yanglingensis]MDQ2586683.1 hypothetical protein [Saccharothrix yanglingensis]